MMQFKSIRFILLSSSFDRESRGTENSSNLLKVTQQANGGIMAVSQSFLIPDTNHDSAIAIPQPTLGSRVRGGFAPQLSYCLFKSCDQVT